MLKLFLYFQARVRCLWDVKVSSHIRLVNFTFYVDDVLQCLYCWVKKKPVRVDLEREINVSRVSTNENR